MKKKKRYIYIYFFVFSRGWKKLKKKKKGAVNDLATAKTVSRYNGVLYRDMALGCAIRLRNTVLQYGVDWPGIVLQ